MCKIVVTGDGGQLASELKFLMENNKSWTFLSISDLDIANNSQVTKYFFDNPCDFIINCAAYTSVDNAESDPSNAYLVNKIGVKNLLEVCDMMGSKFIHYSTDYVFEGNNNKPLKEDDITNPNSVYGHSKLAGEIIIKKSNVKSIIIRTAWVYSNYGNNFVKTMIKLSKESNELGIVHDQIGSPTYAKDLAKLTLEILSHKNYKWKIGDIFHYSSEGSCSWYEFAQEIFKLKKINIQLNKLNSNDYKTKAKRPQFSLLSKEKIKKTFNFAISNWKISLKEMLENQIL